MALRKIIIFTEDRYGCEFLRKLIQRLVDKSIISDIKVEKCGRLAGKCNPKTTRQLKASCELIEYDKLLIISDGENMDMQNVEKQIRIHIPEGTCRNIALVIIDSMIEEWICQGLCINYGSNPVKDLSDWVREHKNRRRGYKKYMLPSFAEIIDLNKLMGNRSFQRFLQALQ